MILYLDSYPIESTNNACEHYRKSFDWSGISEEIKQNGAFHFNVSDVLELFPCLSLDERYDLYCYVSREYHGLWGHVAAVRKDTAPNPTNIQPHFLLGHSFELPDAALPPMEVIYNDGSPFGYLEALLAAKLLTALPYTCFEKDHWQRCAFYPPAHFESEWECYIDLSDWRPRLLRDGWKDRDNTMYLCWRQFENGFGSSDGRDTICLAQHKFLSNLALYHGFAPKKTRPVYKSQLDEDSRYGETNRCCVATVRELMLAREKSRY